MAEVDYLKGLFEAQKEHIDFRFDRVDAAVEECKLKNIEQDKQLKKLEGRKKLDLAASAGGGVVGGFLAMAGKLLWPGGES